MSDEGSELELAGSADYYIQSVDLSADPKVGSSIPGTIELELEMTDPELDSEALRLTCEGELEMRMMYHNTEHEEPSEHGSVIVHFIAAVEPDLLEDDEEREAWISRAQESIEVWEEDGYESVDTSIKFELESELFSELLVPIANMLDSQYTGIMPRVLFGSETPDRTEETDE